MIGKSIIISVKAKYKIGQRLAFIARNTCTFDGKLIVGKWTHHVGYIKQIRRSLFGAKYVVCKSKSDEIFIVPQRDIIGIVEKRENTNKSNKSENGDYRQSNR